MENILITYQLEPDLAHMFCILEEVFSKIQNRSIDMDLFPIELEPIEVSRFKHLMVLSYKQFQSITMKGLPPVFDPYIYDCIDIMDFSIFRE